MQFKKKISNFLLFRYLLIALLWLYPFTVLEVIADPLKSPSNLINALRNDRKIHLTDITQSLISKSVAPNEFNRWGRPFSSLKDYYNVNLEELQEHYPPDLFSNNFSHVFEEFSGTQQFPFRDIFASPYIPIGVLAMDFKKMSLSKLQVSLSGKKIYGLRLVSPFNSRYKRFTGQSLADFGYMPTVNARVLGFTHAQVILELSDNLEPSINFQYNGYLDWRQHQRYRRNDQVSFPIELTNFAHSISGTYYTISAHPDFSLRMVQMKKLSASVTFFLWKENPQKRQVPDFIFQAILLPLAK